MIPINGTQDNYLKDITRHPVGDLGVIAMPGCEDIVDMVDSYLLGVRSGLAPDDECDAIVRKTFKMFAKCPRFGTGEGKGILSQSVRGYDIYIICDVFNYGVKYKMYGAEVPMSPDDHYQDLKRVIAAIGSTARRVTVIMPMLYEGRQHRRTARESLDCAMALQELMSMGVSTVITFDAHDPRVQNAIPLGGFEDVHPTYQMIKAMVNNVPDIKFDKEKTMIISPDEGGMGRCIYYASVLGLDLGMFYKRRDYSTIVNGRNPIIDHQFLGDNVDGKDVIIVDDMISTGDSVIDIAEQLKDLGANRVFMFSSFAMFTEGLSRMDEAYEKGHIEKVFSTNLTYRNPELIDRPWYCEVDMSKFLSYIIDTLNRDKTIAELINPVKKINTFLVRRGLKKPEPKDKK